MSNTATWKVYEVHASSIADPIYKKLIQNLKHWLNSLLHLMEGGLFNTNNTDTILKEQSFQI
jgi:hypothetical protein